MDTQYSFFFLFERLIIMRLWFIGAAIIFVHCTVWTFFLICVLHLEQTAGSYCVTVQCFTDFYFKRIKEETTRQMNPQQNEGKWNQVTFVAILKKKFFLNTVDQYQSKIIDKLWDEVFILFCSSTLCRDHDHCLVRTLYRWLELVSFTR